MLPKPQVEHGRYFNKGYGTLERFIAYHEQSHLVATCLESGTVLEVGIGDGMVSHYLKKLGYSVTKCDIDENLKPDVVASVKELPFSDDSFDLIMACEILEHIPFEDFGEALDEICRVTKRNAVISLPYRSTVFELVLKLPFMRSLFKKNFLDIVMRIPLRFGGFETSGQHYWEIDSSEFSLRKVREEVSKHFKIVTEERAALDPFHYYFVLEKP